MDEEMGKNREKLVEISRELYGKNVDLAGEFRGFEESGRITVESANACFFPGVLWNYHVLENIKGRIWDEINKAWFDKKIDSSTAIKAQTVISEVERDYIDSAFDALRKKCGCKMRE